MHPAKTVLAPTLKGSRQKTGIHLPMNCTHSDTYSKVPTISIERLMQPDPLGRNMSLCFNLHSFIGLTLKGDSI